MKLLDVLTAPWAILPDKLLEIQNIYATHLRGEKIDLKAVEAQIGKPLQNEPRRYENQNGVGVIRVEGVLARRANLMTRVSGGTSTEMMRSQFREAMNDRDAESILFVIDSPGGTVDGTQEFAEEIYRARGKKPIKAVALGTVASAAYWIGAAADELYLASDTTVAGSIGVVATHVDVSRAEDRMGIKTTEITAGKYKRIASQYGPLSQEGRASMQEMVDGIYTAFVNDVAAFRKRSVDAVLEKMADGRIFLGSKAIEAGLADGFVMEQDILAALQRGRMGGFAKRAIGSSGRQHEGASMDKKAIVESLTLEELKAMNPALAEACMAEGQTVGFSAGREVGAREGKEAVAGELSELRKKALEEGKALGAEAERERIKSVEAQALPGHTELIEQLKYDGKTTGPEAAVKILQHEKEARTIHREKLKTDALAPIEQPAISATSQAGKPGGATGEDKSKEREKLIAAYQAEHQCDYRAAAFAVSKVRPELFRDR